MVEIFGKTYFIDFDRVTDTCRIEGALIPDILLENNEEEENEEELVAAEAGNDISAESNYRSIDIFKYELIKMCIERVLSEDSEVDSKMGELSVDGLSISFKMAYNTLIKYKILIEDNE